MCPGEFVEASGDNSKTILDVKDGGTLYEDVETEQACYWKIKSPIKDDYFIEDKSELTFVLETADNAEVYIYKGSDREEAESIIEEGDKLYPGNPLRITHLDDILVVFRKKVDGQYTFIEGVGDIYETFDGSFSLAYEVTGPQYSFWQQPFVYHDDNDYWWWAFRIFVAVIFLTSIGCFTYSCIVRPCCLRKPVCCLCCYDNLDN